MFLISFHENTVFLDILSEIRFSALFQQNTVILDLTPSEKQFVG